ncbi:hypothetical protein N9P08_03400, partial [Alphaproteobacteria bacterium]|nr:hypothetical protein [Alphaproteobacteria bacterium]
IWLRPDGSQQTIIKAMEDQITSSNAIVAEIIDCWFELRAIKDLLTGEEVEIAIPEKSQTHLFGCCVRFVDAFIVACYRLSKPGV